MRVDNVVARRLGGSPRLRALLTTPWWRIGATAPGDQPFARWVAAAVIALGIAVPTLDAMETDPTDDGDGVATASATVDSKAKDGRTGEDGRTAEDRRRAAAAAASRSGRPAPVPAPRTQAQNGRTQARNGKPAQASKRPTAQAKPKPARPAKPRPVGGLTQAQMDNAAVIVTVGRQSKLPRRAQVIAVATAMQESTLRNLANPSHPASLKMPNQGTGFDFDSLGLFQQRPASGWGSPRELMDRVYASKAFYKALTNVPGWQGMSLTEAAQTVQGSAFPDAYAKHERLATQVVNALD